MLERAANYTGKWSEVRSAFTAFFVFNRLLYREKKLHRAVDFRRLRSHFRRTLALCISALLQAQSPHRCTCPTLYDLKCDDKRLEACRGSGSAF